MPRDIAARLASALNVRSQTAIHQIDRALSDYARLVPQAGATPLEGEIATSQVTSGTFADARIAESNVTQHEAALSIDAGLQLTNTLADARVAESNVMQHQAALLNAGNLGKVNFGLSESYVRGGAVTLADDATGTFDLGSVYAAVLVVTSFNTDANVLFMTNATTTANVFTGSLASLGTSSNPDVDGSANYWKSTSTELSIKNRLGSEREFSVFVFGRQ